MKLKDFNLETRRHILFAPIMAFFMTLIVTLVANAVAGFVLAKWLISWMIAWPIASSVILLFGQQIKKRVDLIIKK